MILTCQDTHHYLQNTSYTTTKKSLISLGLIAKIIFIEVKKNRVKHSLAQCIRSLKFFYRSLTKYQQDHWKYNFYKETNKNLTRFHPIKKKKKTTTTTTTITTRIPKFHKQSNKPKIPVVMVKNHHQNHAFSSTHPFASSHIFRIIFASSFVKIVGKVYKIMFNP